MLSQSKIFINQSKGNLMTNKSDIDHMLSVKDCAQILGVSTKTIREYISKGKLKASKTLPKRIRIWPNNLISFIENR